MSDEFDDLDTEEEGLFSHEKPIPCEPDDPNRCQGIHRNGQCRYKAIPTRKYCAMHGGARGRKATLQVMKRQYQLAKWQDTVDAFADDDEVKSLRGEIGIARMVLQETITRCKDSGELLMESARIGELVSKIERLVTTCHRIESNLGMLLDKTKIMALAMQIVEIIGEHVKDDDQIASISAKIVDTILSTQGNSDT